MTTSDPGILGARAELEVAHTLSRLGTVYVPFFRPDSRADLLLVRGNEVTRVQCKHSHLVARGSAIAFKTTSNTRNVPRGYDGEVDAFGVYSSDLDTVFLVPIADVPSRAATLRLGAPANGQRKGIRWAETYRVDAVGERRP